MGEKKQLFLVVAHHIRYDIRVICCETTNLIFARHQIEVERFNEEEEDQGKYEYEVYELIGKV